MRFDPKTDKYPYPEYTDRHYLKIKKNDGTVFDRDYPYIDKSGWFRFKQKMVRILLNVIVFPLATIRLGLKIEGRENIKKYKDILDDGVISVCNHVHMCDYISVMNAIRPYKSSVLVWAPNINDKSEMKMNMPKASYFFEYFLTFIFVFSNLSISLYTSKSFCVLVAR